MSFTRPIEIEMIRQQAADAHQRKTKAGHVSMVCKTGPDARLLRTKKANDWMKQEHGKPPLKQLFGSFWHEEELCILFADTNLGKSILAVQIGDSITKNYSIGPFANATGAGLPVLYLDCEQSAKQFEARYHHPQWGSYLFADGFYRAEFNPAMDNPVNYDTYENYMRDEIDFALTDTKARVLIIDNITYMRHGTEQARDAQPLMKTLKALKTKYRLSVLVLAHTPKRDRFKPLTVNDLQGSKMLINFADSAFAIGQSQSQPGLRYLKQIKQRNNEEVYGEGNVCLISRLKDVNFLGYQFEGYARERDHLHRPEQGIQPHQKQQILQLHQQGRSLRQIAHEVDVSVTTVRRMVMRG